MRRQRLKRRRWSPAREDRPRHPRPGRRICRTGAAPGHPARVLPTRGQSGASVLLLPSAPLREAGSQLRGGRVTLSAPRLRLPSPPPTAADALKGPRLVSGEPGGAVTVRCHYTPSPVNRHQRKYWCRLSPLTGLCHTLVSTNRYTHLRYRGRVALADFPQSGVFVVRLSPLSPGDTGSYRCGIGDRNNMLFLSVSLTVSVGTH